MSIKAGCGHVLAENEGFGFNICIKGYDENNHKVIQYITVCFKCLIYYRTEFKILDNREDEINWLYEK